MKPREYHIPVLATESLAGLSVQPTGLYADVTFGGGGHSRMLLERLAPEGHLFGFDQDPDAAANAPADERFTFVAANFRYLCYFLDFYGVLGKLDGLIADLGVSSHQFDTAERGFSFRAETPLADMRMNSRGGRTAADILTDYTEEQLADIFYEYGELRQGRRIARRVIAARESGSCPRTVGELAALARPDFSPKEEKSLLARLFQSLRIEVNDEMGALRDLLEGAYSALRPGGRLAVITYHSLEDRMVKNALREIIPPTDTEQLIYGRGEMKWKSVLRKPQVPTEIEVAGNPRARSAKLRVAEKV